MVLSAIMATGFLLLLAFHSYLLLYARKGTYDWLLARRGGRLYEQSSFRSSYHTNAGGDNNDEVGIVSLVLLLSQFSTKLCRL